MTEFLNRVGSPSTNSLSNIWADDTLRLLISRAVPTEVVTNTPYNFGICSTQPDPHSYWFKYYIVDVS